jgi:XTP/dITP diphosphohydrolase
MLIFATNNENKAKEVQAILPAGMQVVTLKQAGIDQEIPEPFDTLEENALEKARVIHRLAGKNCFSEDTGLEVDALEGAPGVHSARYAGEARSDSANMEKLLRQMEGKTARRARFRTVLALIWNNEEHLFEGVCTGHIAFAPSGSNGFGYDPVFIPEGSDRSFAAMTLEEKSRFSHRKKAVSQLVAFLKQVT